MLIMIGLIPLLFFSIIAIIFGDSFISLVNPQGSLENELIINGSTSEIEFSSADLLFNIDPLTGGIVILVTIIGIVAILGVNILGSGLSDNAVKIISLCIVYGSLWTVLSFLSYPIIIEIEIFGSLIYITLTLLYVIGIIKKFTEG